MTLDIKEIAQGLPGLSKASGQHLYEGCVVCLTRQNHKYSGTSLQVYGDTKIDYNLIWDNIFDDQLDKTWADQFYATEHGAVCLAVILALKLTDFTIIEHLPEKMASIIGWEKRMIYYFRKKQDWKYLEFSMEAKKKLMRDIR